LAKPPMTPRTHGNAKNGRPGSGRFWLAMAGHQAWQSMPPKQIVEPNQVDGCSAPLSLHILAEPFFSPESAVASALGSPFTAVRATQALSSGCVGPLPCKARFELGLSVKDPLRSVIERSRATMFAGPTPGGDAKGRKHAGKIVRRPVMPSTDFGGKARPCHPLILGSLVPSGAFPQAVRNHVLGPCPWRSFYRRALAAGLGVASPGMTAPNIVQQHKSRFPCPDQPPGTADVNFFFSNQRGFLSFSSKAEEPVVPLGPSRAGGPRSRT